MPVPSFFRSNGFKVLVYVMGSIVLGALLAPPLFWAGKAIVDEGWLAGGIFDSLHGSMDRARFSRYFNRAIVLAALLLLWPCLRWMSRGNERGKPLRERLLLERNPRWAMHLLAGFLLAGGALLLHGWIYVLLDLYRPRPEHDAIAGILASALMTGFAVAFLEEFVFRGALHGIFARVTPPVMLWIGLAAFFAFVHFLKPPRSYVLESVQPWSGFQMVGAIFGQLGDPYFLAAEFAVLFAIGLVLGWVRMKTASLWLAIGLHAGWVFAIKTLNPLMVRDFPPEKHMPWLGDTMRVGAVSCIAVLLTGLVAWLGLRGNARNAFARPKLPETDSPSGATS